MTSKMNSSAVKHISECFIKPKHEVKESKHPYHLTSWGLSLLSFQYMQNGLLFAKPKFDYSTQNLLTSLKESLSLTLVDFYPLAGQLTSQVNEERHECLVFVDCNKGPGARFVHATLDMTTMYDILSSTDVPLVVHSFFDHHNVVNHEGHTRPMLSVQVTELLDGVFIGVSLNHAVADGTSLWQFWNAWSEVHRAAGKQTCLSHPPVHNTWFPSGSSPGGMLLPFTNPAECISRYEAPQLRERIFHFSSDCVKRLKQVANEEITNTNKINISSLQALTALIWKSIVRASHLSHDQVTNCGLAINNRHRLDPPLPKTYFPNSINLIQATTSVGQLLGNNLGQTALLVHQSVSNHNNKAICNSLKEWMESPFVDQLETASDSYSVLMSNSPTFDMYGNNFGFGKPLAVRSGCNNKYAGHIAMYPGYEGGRSMDMEVCLPPDSMEALESDNEFMDAIFLPHTRAKELPRTPKQFSKI